MKPKPRVPNEMRNVKRNSPGMKRSLTEKQKLRTTQAINSCWNSELEDSRVNEARLSPYGPDSLLT
jgi:hypothetical protein